MSQKKNTCRGKEAHGSPVMKTGARERTTNLKEEGNGPPGFRKKTEKKRRGKMGVPPPPGKKGSNGQNRKRDRKGDEHAANTKGPMSPAIGKGEETGRGME